MAAIIKATGISIGANGGSAITHAAEAAKACLSAAELAPDQLDVLINVGVYRDSNMIEPAIAALIQKELNLNLDYVKSAAPKPAFSFDLMNGACGVLNAVQVASALLADTEYVMIVSGDAHPSMEIVPDFPYATVGGAMLLTRGDDQRTGFGPVWLQDAPGDGLGLQGFVGFPDVGPEGRRRITIQRDPDATERLLELATRSAREVSEAEQLDLRRTLLVPSQMTPGFGAALAERLGIELEAVASTASVAGDPHTSALTLGYHHAVASGQSERFDAMLFVTVGAGLTAACAAYRPVRRKA